jgi:hypothetical protein
MSVAIGHLTMDTTQIELITAIHKELGSLRVAINSAVATGNKSGAIAILEQISEEVAELKQQATGDEED